MKIHHVAIATDNLAETQQWYCQHFDFVQTHQMQGESMDIVLLRLGEVSLEIFQLDNPQPQPAYEQDLMQDLRYTGVRHFAIQVADLTQKLEQLRQAGVAVISEIQEPFYGGQYAFVQDNNGILLELVQPPQQVYFKISSEALHKPELLNDYTPLKTHIGIKPQATDEQVWHQYFFAFERDSFAQQAATFSQQMKEGWYAIGITADMVWVVMKDTVFELAREKHWQSEQYQAMRQYAMDHGVEAEFLDFNERFVEYEQWIAEVA